VLRPIAAPRHPAELCELPQQSVDLVPPGENAADRRIAVERWLRLVGVARDKRRRIDRNRRLAAIRARCEPAESRRDLLLSEPALRSLTDTFRISVLVRLRVRHYDMGG